MLFSMVTDTNAYRYYSFMVSVYFQLLHIEDMFI